jgi:hypothetical protein
MKNHKTNTKRNENKKIVGVEIRPIIELHMQK